MAHFLVTLARFEEIERSTACRKESCYFLRRDRRAGKEFEFAVESFDGSAGIDKQQSVRRHFPRFAAQFSVKTRKSSSVLQQKIGPSIRHL